MLHQYFPILAVIVALSAGDIEVNVDEEVSVGTEVTRLPDHRSIFGSLSTDQIQTMTYAILSQNSPPASYFNIDPKTGIVTVASRMDRENICDHIERCSVKVNIAIQAGGQSHVSFSTVVTLEVVINDVNDNPPRFPPREVSLEIPEGAKLIACSVSLRHPCNHVDSKSIGFTFLYELMNRVEKWGSTNWTALTHFTAALSKQTKSMEHAP